MSSPAARSEPWGAPEDPSWFGWPESSIQALLSADVTPWRILQVCDGAIAARCMRSGGAPRRARLLVREAPDGEFDHACSTGTGAFGNPLALVTDGAPAVRTETPSPMTVEVRPVEQDGPRLRLWAEHEGQVVGCLELEAAVEIRAHPSPESWRFLAAMAGAAIERHRHRIRLERAQIALASTTRYLDRLLGLVSDGLIVLDVDGTILCLNPSAQELLGAGVETVSRPLGEWLEPHCGSAVLALVQLAARQSTPVTRVIQWVSAGCAREEGRPVEVSVERVQPDPELPAGLLVCLRDLEPAAQQAWFQRVEEVRATQMSALADSLTRPMAALRAYLWLIREELPVTGRAAELWASLDLQAEWLQGRLDTLAVLDQFRLRQPTWRDLSVDPRALLDRALGRVRSRLELQGLAFEVSTVSSVPRVRVDVEKCVLVLAHLLDELAHHVSGPGRIEASFELRLTPTARVELRLGGTRAPATRGTPAADYEQLANAAGVEETRSLYALPLARAVVHRYGGTLVWDRSGDHTAAVVLTLPCDPGEPRD